MEQRAERLVRRARNGDTEAFTQLILRNEEMLSRVALSLLHNMEDAADAVQDAILGSMAGPSLPTGLQDISAPGWCAFSFGAALRWVLPKAGMFTSSWRKL